MTSPKHDIAIASVHAVTGISRTKLLSKARTQPIVEARQLLILLLAQDGFKDENIGFIIKRTRSNVFRRRQLALEKVNYSKLFNEKLQKIIRHYDRACK